MSRSLAILELMQGLLGGLRKMKDISEVVTKLEKVLEQLLCNVLST